MKFEHKNVDRCRNENCQKILPQGVVFPKKPQKCITKFQRLATSGRVNSMITVCRKFTTKWSLYGMSGFHFNVRVNSKSFLWAVHAVLPIFWRL